MVEAHNLLQCCQMAVNAAKRIFWQRNRALFLHRYGEMRTEGDGDWDTQRRVVVLILGCLPTDMLPFAKHFSSISGEKPGQVGRVVFRLMGF